MATKLKSIKASLVYRRILVLLFFAVCVIIGVVTGFAGAYGYMADDYYGVESLLVDSPADSDLVWGMSFSNMETIKAKFNKCETYESRVQAVESCDFYVKIEYSYGAVFSNNKEYVPQTMCTFTQRNEVVELGDIGYVENEEYIVYNVALTSEQYNTFCDSWNQMKGNMQIILVTDIFLLIGAIVLGVLICSSAGLQPDGTSQLKPFFKTPYELLLLLIAGLLYLCVITAVCEFHLDDVAELGAGGKNVCMALCGAACGGFGLSVLYLFVCAAVRSRCGAFYKGSLCVNILSLLWRGIKFVGRQIMRLFRAIGELFSGRIFSSQTAATSLLILDILFIAVSVFLLLLLFIVDGSPAVLMLEIAAVVFFLFQRYQYVRDSAVVERKIKSLTEGVYTFDEKLSKRSAFKHDMEQLDALSEGYKKSVEESVHAERMKIELVTNVSHDLKTPLTSIISYVELLSKEELPPVAQDYVKVLQTKSERLKNIVSDVFELAKTTSGEISVEKERLDLTKLSWQTLGEMEDKITNAGLELRAKICDPPVTVISDGKRLYRILQNLLDNAVKYSLNGTRVYYTLNRLDQKAVITIKNISACEMDFTPDEILERFSRGDKSRTTEGSGLGLSIAQGFTLACGGKFNVDIDGDMFKVTLEFPLAAQDDNSKGAQNE